MNLEILSRREKVQSSKPPLLFVHGAYVGAWCWDEHFLAWFAARGYESHAVSLRGHGESGGREQLNDFGLADYAEDVARAAAELSRPPVLIGQSMGALVVQKVLEKSPETPAMVLASPVPSYGLLPSSFTLAFTKPALFASLNTVASGGRASPEALSTVLFADPPEPAVLEKTYRRMQRESRRAMLDMSGWSLPNPWFAWGAAGTRRPPTLVLGAGRDALISAHEAQATARMLGADYQLLPELGHAVMLDAGWQAAAQAIADWLGERGL
jgi:pimeloyl-ACP methyl ester carboxylesterase